MWKKQIIVRSSLGRAALFVRAFAERIAADAETLPALLNDQLATRIVVRLCRPGMTFLDIGAHIGSVTAEVTVRVTDVRVIAVEAMPDKADTLRRKFPDVEVHGIALGEEDGEVAFYVNDKQSGYSSLAPNGGREIRIQKTRLDSIVSRRDVDVIKIDVEGAEQGVLIGGTRLIEQCRPVIMFESGPQECLGYTKADMFAWFTGKGYELFVPNRLPHTAPPLTRDVFLDSHLYPRRTTNYFAVPAERTQEIRARTPVMLDHHSS
jgi:FkbM family methyltransferase